MINKLIFLTRFSICCVCLFFISCGQKKEPVHVEQQSPLELVNADFFKLLPSCSNAFVVELYELNTNKLIWCGEDLSLNSNGLELIGVFESALDFGLNPANYLTKDELSSKSPIDRDTMLTSCFVRFVSDLNYGMLAVDSATPFPLVNFDRKLLFENFKGFGEDSLLALISSFEPAHYQYQQLVLALKKYVRRTGLSTQKKKVKSNKQDSLNNLNAAAEALVIHGLLDTVDLDHGVLTNAIKVFQKEHGLNADGVVGSKTAKLLSKSPYDYFLSAVLALDKWRKKEVWGKDRIDINIPGYSLRYFKNDSLDRLHKVIIGNVKAQTIEILDSVEYLVVYPYWYVPRSIINHEMLPKARKDSTYFTRKGFEILKGRKVVAAENLDYNGSFRYTVRQKGGASNALGLVKFIFPNPSSIYLHDTPSKRLFSKEVRAFSHGCIRLQNPLDLAYKVLADDGSAYSKKRVKEIIKNKERTRINLNKKLPIYVHYTLASVIDSNIVFHEDIYNREKASIKAIRRVFNQ